MRAGSRQPWSSRPCAGAETPDIGSGRALVDRLGLRPGARVQLLGLDEAAWFADLVRERGAHVVATPPFDIVFLRVDAAADLEQLSRIRERIVPNGAIWVIRAKGKSRALSEVDIITAARRHGLVDNKIAGFSDSLAAMRLVVPVALRGSKQ